MTPTALARYLADSGESCESLAKKIGVSKSTISRWATGKRAPPVVEAIALERTTRGAVPVGSWARPAEQAKSPRRASVSHA
jgi:DNA-binding transcriptional regulator YdaS (Cro superfamily)